MSHGVLHDMSWQVMTGRCLHLQRQIKHGFWGIWSKLKEAEGGDADFYTHRLICNNIISSSTSCRRVQRHHPLNQRQFTKTTSPAKGGKSMNDSICTLRFWWTSQLHVGRTRCSNKRSRWYSIPSISHLKVNEMNAFKNESWVEISQSFTSLPFHSFCRWL